jgi:hypothetical protein
LGRFPVVSLSCQGGIAQPPATAPASLGLASNQTHERLAEFKSKGTKEKACGLSYFQYLLKI